MIKINLFYENLVRLYNINKIKKSIIYPVFIFFYQTINTKYLLVIKRF